MRRTRYFTVPLGCYSDLCDTIDLPRGEIFAVAINPWNGNIVFSFQDNPTARFFSCLVLDQLASYEDVFLLANSRSGRSDEVGDRAFDDLEACHV